MSAVSNTHCIDFISDKTILPSVKDCEKNKRQKMKTGRLCMK